MDTAAFIASSKNGVGDNFTFVWKVSCCRWCWSFQKVLIISEFILFLELIIFYFVPNNVGIFLMELYYDRK